MCSILARVSLVHAAYSEVGIIPLNGHFSAVGAYVGKAFIDECMFTIRTYTTTLAAAGIRIRVLGKMDAWHANVALDKLAFV